MISIRKIKFGLVHRQKILTIKVEIVFCQVCFEKKLMTSSEYVYWACKRVIVVPNECVLKNRVRTYSNALTSTFRIFSTGSYGVFEKWAKERESTI